MLYKASTTPALDARRPVITRTRVILAVAQRLGAGSSIRAMHEFAEKYPRDFWTQLYAKTIEKGPDVQVNVQVNTQQWTFGDKKVEF